MGAREWDGRSYDRVSGPMERLGLAVLARLELRGDETVLDAGCGSGRVTAALLERLPGGHVIAVDGSADMLVAARERLGEDPRLRLEHQDLAALRLAAPVDHVLSTATFHWIADHDGLFARLHAALQPGGRLVAQCGGAGNVAAVHAAAEAVGARAPYREHLSGWAGPWNFQPPGATAGRLERAGFTTVDVRTWPHPVIPDAPLEYLRTIVLGAHVQRLPEAQREPFARDVAAALGDEVTIDYVRMDIDAVSG